MEALDQIDDIGRYYPLLQSADYDEETAKHDEQRLVDLAIDLLWFHSAGDKQQAPAKERHLCDGLAKEEQENHCRGYENGFENQRPMVARRLGSTCKLLPRQELSTEYEGDERNREDEAYSSHRSKRACEGAVGNAR
jgi:hypothetical protein